MTYASSEQYALTLAAVRNFGTFNIKHMWSIRRKGFSTATVDKVHYCK